MGMVPVAPLVERLTGDGTDDRTEIHVAVREPEIQPDRVLDQGGRELMAGIRDRRCPSRITP